MKMTHHEREFLLSQIAAVLSDLQRLVCQLNSVQIEEEVSNVKILCQNVVAPSLNVVSNDVKYSIAFDCDLTSDDDVSSISSQQSSLLSWDITEDYPVNPVSDSQIQVEKSIPKECSFVSKVKAFISSFANVYSKERSTQIKQEILDENVFHEFQQMWRHSIVGDLFIQNPDSAQIPTLSNPAPEIKYKTVDFSKLNSRNLVNIPKPERHPIQGCSEDPRFYSESVILSHDYYGRPHTLDSSHQKSMPFGSLYGYRTNEGIVPVPTTPVFGYVWSDQDGTSMSANWVLHAVHPPEERPVTRAPSAGPRSPTTWRPPSTRRGCRTSRPRREGKG